MNSIIAIIKSSPASNEKEVYKIFNKNKISNSDLGFYIKNKKTQKVFMDTYSLKGDNIQWFFNNYLHKNEMIVGCFQENNEKTVIQPITVRKRIYSVFDGFLYNYEELKEKYKLMNVTNYPELVGSLYMIKYTSSGNNLTQSIINLNKELSGVYFFVLYDDLLKKMIVVDTYMNMKVSYKKYDHYFICEEEPEDMFYEFRPYPFFIATIIDFNKLEIEKHIEL